MNTNHCGRFWPALTLSGLVCAGLAYDVGGTWPRPACPTRAPVGGELAALERQLGQGPGDSRLWRRYADGLRDARRYSDAARAYAAVLKIDPVNREVQFLLAQMLALTGNGDGLFACVAELALTDPQLVFDILDRQESKPYLGEARFRRLYEESRAQYID